MFARLIRRQRAEAWLSMLLAWAIVRVVILQHPRAVELVEAGGEMGEFVVGPLDHGGDALSHVPEQRVCGFRPARHVRGLACARSILGRVDGSLPPSLGFDGRRGEVIRMLGLRPLLGVRCPESQGAGVGRPGRVRGRRVGRLRGSPGRAALASATARHGPGVSASTWDACPQNNQESLGESVRP